MDCFFCKMVFLKMSHFHSRNKTSRRFYITGHANTNAPFSNASVYHPSFIQARAPVSAAQHNRSSYMATYDNAANPSGHLGGVLVSETGNMQRFHSNPNVFNNGGPRPYSHAQISHSHMNKNMQWNNTFNSVLN